jgi:hypothetical protein
MASTTAPTEDEIREAVRRASDTSRFDVGQLVYDLLRPLHYVRPAERGPAYGDGPKLWDDLRPSQAARLDDLSDAVYTEGNSLEATLIETLREMVIRAALTFATEYPDAPRAKVAEAIA